MWSTTFLPAYVLTSPRTTTGDPSPPPSTSPAGMSSPSEVGCCVVRYCPGQQRVEGGSRAPIRRRLRIGYVCPRGVPPLSRSDRLDPAEGAHWPGRQLEDSCRSTRRPAVHAFN